MMMDILDLLLRRAPAPFPATWASLPLRNLGNHQTKHPTIICRAPMPHWCRFGLIFPTRSAVLGRISDARAQSAHRKCEAFTHNVSIFEHRRTSRRARQKPANQPASFRDIRPFLDTGISVYSNGLLSVPFLLKENFIVPRSNSALLLPSTYVALYSIALVHEVKATSRQTMPEHVIRPNYGLCASEIPQLDASFPAANLLPSSQWKCLESVRSSLK